MYMTFTLTVTSQGQVSIPAKLRKLWSLTGGKQITITLSGENKAIVEPVSDFISLGGSLNKYASINKGLTIDEIIARENKAIEDSWAERYIEKEKRSGSKIAKIKTW